MAVEVVATVAAAPSTVVSLSQAQMPRHPQSRQWSIVARQSRRSQSVWAFARRRPHGGRSLIVVYTIQVSLPPARLTQGWALHRFF